MKSRIISDNASRLIGFQLSSVLTAIDYITLKFVKYPLCSDGHFADGMVIDIDAGFSVRNCNIDRIFMKNQGVQVFQQGSKNLIDLIGMEVGGVSCYENGEFGMVFENATEVRLLVSAEGFDSFEILWEQRSCV